MATITTTGESWNNHSFSEVETHLKGYYSKTGHTHSYLPLAGGKFSESDSITIDAFGNFALNSKDSAYWHIDKSDGTNMVMVRSSGGVDVATAITLKDGNDLVLQAPSSGSRTNDAGDLVFKNGSGTEIGRFWIDDSSLTFKLRYGENDTGKTIYHEGNLTFKTINGQSIVGSGNIDVSGGGGGGGNYLPLAGGTLTGILTTTAINDVIRIKNNTSFAAIRFYEGNGDSDFAAIHGFVASSFRSTAGKFNIQTDTMSFGSWEKPIVYIDTTVSNTGGVYFNGSSSASTNSSGFRIGRCDETLGGLKMQFGANGTNLAIIDSGWTISLLSLGNTGNLTVAGGVTSLSDARHKSIVSDTDITVEQIAKMSAVKFKWTDEVHDKEVHVGSIAQEWQSVLPQVVTKANDEEGTLSLNYGVAALVSSITTARKVVDHEEEIKALKARIKVLEEKENSRE